MQRDRGLSVLSKEKRNMYPLKFEPILKKTLWGGDKIVAFKKMTEHVENVGESWEVSAVEGSESVVANGADRGLTLTELVGKYGAELLGEANYRRFGQKFPLLVKFIDAKQKLSVQVHPSDALAKQRHGKLGKNEMWYVVGAEQGAALLSGFKKKISSEEYLQKVADGSFLDVVQSCEVKPGDVCYVPAGRVHGIGAGTFVVEIQETSDVTYRIFDYNRRDKDGNLRELHTELACEAIDFDDVGEDFRIPYEARKNEPVGLVSTPYFTTSLYDMDEAHVCDYSRLDSFVILICVDGACLLTDDAGNETRLSAGETVLLPASIRSVRMIPDSSGVRLLETYV